MTPTGIDATGITAHEDVYEIGAEINLTAVFQAVSGSDPTFHPATANPVAAAYFATPELTDDHGRTYAFVNDSTALQDVTTSVEHRYGVAELVVTLDNIDAVSLAAIPESDKSMTVTISGEEHTKIIGKGVSAPDYEAADGTDLPYADADIELAFVIESDGTGATLDSVAPTAVDTDEVQGNDAWQWTVRFYYGIEPENADNSAKDETSDHSSNTITVTIA